MDLLGRGGRHRVLDIHLKEDAALAGLALLAEQKARQHRLTDPLDQGRRRRQLVICKVAQIGAQGIQITHLCQPEQHVQLVLELVGRRPQCFGIAADTGQLFGQGVDLALVAEGGDGADHPALMTDRRTIGEDRPTVEAELTISLLGCAGQHLGQATVGQVFGDRPAQRWFAEAGAGQQALGGGVDQGDARLVVHRQNAFAHRGQHRLTLLHQPGNLVGFQPQQHALDIACQQVRTEGGDQHQRQYTEHHAALMSLEQFAERSQGDPHRDSTEHRSLVVQHRSETANTAPQAAIGTRGIGLTGQRRTFVVTAKGLADAGRLRVRQAQGARVHHHDEVHAQTLAQAIDVPLQRIIGTEFGIRVGQRSLHVGACGHALRQVGHPRSLPLFEGVLQLHVEQPEGERQRQHHHDGDQQRDQRIQAQAHSHHSSA